MTWPAYECRGHIRALKLRSVRYRRTRDARGKDADEVVFLPWDDDIPAHVEPASGELSRACKAVILGDPGYIMVNTEGILTWMATARFERPRAGSRLEYLRARASMEQGELVVELHSNQSSGVLSSVSWANALVVVPPGVTVAAGDRVELVLLDQLNR